MKLFLRSLLFIAVLSLFNTASHAMEVCFISNDHGLFSRSDYWSEVRFNGQCHNIDIRPGWFTSEIYRFPDYFNMPSCEGVMVKEGDKTLLIKAESLHSCKAIAF
jgi:hypothetical protein